MTRTAAPRRLAIAIALSLGLLAALPAAANTDTPPQAIVSETDQNTVDEYDMLVKMAATHPNELHRIYAAKAAADGRWSDAAEQFRKAAYYADKYSQHRLSMLYWHGADSPSYGAGVSRDRVEAYIWADLAAERGYSQFLAIREKMWGELTPQEQEAVAKRGPALYAKYGDPAAKPRFAGAMAKARANRTGSRAGADTSRVISFSPGAGTALFGGIGGLDLSRMNDPERTKPEAYWATEDKIWREATVTVGDIEETNRAPKQDENAQPKP
jgi:uncharacterized protein